MAQTSVWAFLRLGGIEDEVDKPNSADFPPALSSYGSRPDGRIQWLLHYRQCESYDLRADLHNYGSAILSKVYGDGLSHRHADQSDHLQGRARYCARQSFHRQHRRLMAVLRR